MTELLSIGQEIEVHNGTRWTRGKVRSKTWLVLAVETRGGDVLVQRRHISRRVRVPRLEIVRAHEAA